jgi:uncharacterized delta-60 repeat protein
MKNKNRVLSVIVYVCVLVGVTYSQTFVNEPSLFGNAMKKRGISKPDSQSVNSESSNQTNFLANDLDLTFGVNGLSATPFATNTANLISKVLIQPDGKILTAESDARPVVIRRNTDGSLDTAFGLNGIASYPFTGVTFFQSIALQNDGKILLSHVNSLSTLQIVRFNTNGTLDTTFAANGFYTNSLFPFAYANDMVVQTDGKILIGGYAAESSNNDFKIVIRLNSNGVIDNTFATNGVFKLDLGLNDNIRKLLVQTDGKILGIGAINTLGVDSVHTCFRLNTNGSLDSSFGTNGIATIGNGTFELAGVSIQSDGKIVFGGDDSESFTGISYRLNTNGTPDLSYGVGGAVIIQLSTHWFIVRDSTIQTDGKIVLGGAALRLSDSSAGWFVTRLLPNGTVDQTFANSGYYFNYRPIANDRVGIINSVTVQADGKIVCGAYDVESNLKRTKVFRLSADAPRSVSKFIDFDGDNKTDISIFRPSVSQWWYLRSSDNANRVFSFGTSTDKIVPADYTGDGKTDIATFTPSTGFWSILRSENSTYYAYPFGSNGDVAVPADYDADGKADSAVFRPSTQIWYISKSSGGTTITPFGTTGDVPAVGDYDGDGKTDVAIYRVSLGQWWYLRSSDNTNRVFTFGTSTDKPVQGDYTGDGKTDIAFYRPSTGFWFILRSEDSSFYAFPFGTSGDIPVAGDYDGDGKFDAAVFRPSGNNWYISGSTAGTIIRTFGAPGDLPVPNAFVP